jgi:Fe-S cluster assembly iron-binding protein IscA
MLAMLKVTDQAKQALNNLKTEALAQVPPESNGQAMPSLRLVIQGTQAGLSLDFPQETDQVIEVDGATVLLIDQDISQMLDGGVIDVTETPAGPMLTIREEHAEAA